MFVRTTCSSDEPARSSAAPMISRQSRACSYAPSGGGEPSAGIGAVPATCTRSPATTARENPATPSYGELPEMSLRRIGASLCPVRNLLYRPGVPVRIAEEDEPSPREVLDVAHLDTA